MKKNLINAAAFNRINTVILEVYNWWSSAYIESLAVVMELGRSFWNKFQSKGPKKTPEDSPCSFNLIPCFPYFLILLYFGGC